MQLRNTLRHVTAGVVAACALGFAGAVLAADTTIYDSIPSPTPSNLPSLGYQATQTSEFGELISFAPGPRGLTDVTVYMSNWATESTYETVGTSRGYVVPLMLTLYGVGANNAVGSPIASRVVDAMVPWRPEANASCGTGWLDSNGQCFNGFGFEVAFDFTGTVVPDSIIYGLAYNTQTWGYDPTGVGGPYNSLNFGLAVTPASIGSNPLPDTAYWNTATKGWYADGGAGGVGVFRQDTQWSPYLGAIAFAAAPVGSVPEPASLALVALGLAGIGFVRRRAT